MWNLRDEGSDLGDGIFHCPVCFCVAALRLGTLGSCGSQRETSLRQKRLSTVLCLALPLPSSRRSHKHKKSPLPKPKRKNSITRMGNWVLLVAGVGFEPHDLRVMSPTSYQTAPSRDMIGAGSRGRTGTRNKSHGILSPGRLPIPPFRQTTTLDFLIAIILYHHFAKKSIPF